MTAAAAPADLKPVMTEDTVVARPAELRPIRPVVAWAVLGAVFVVLNLWIFGAWVFSGDFYRTVPSGPDDVAHGTKVLGWIFQIGSPIAGAAALVYLVRRTRREGRLPWDAMVAAGFVTCFWMDSLINFYRPVLLFNSNLVNFGSWDPHIPGWVMPNARELPEPVLLTAPIYIWMFMGFGIVACALARRARTQWPDIGKVGLFGINVLAIGVIDLILEVVFIRSGLYAYSAVINELSIFPGSRYQFPIYESVIVGVLGATIGMLRYNRDDKGRSAIEKGIENTTFSDRGRNVVRALAFIGFINAIFVVANVVFIALTFYVDETPHYPSYMTNGLCGEDTGIPCPGPEVPVVLPHTPLPIEITPEGSSSGGEDEG